MRFEAGQTIVRRLLHPGGRLAGCVAGRVVADDANGLLTWIDARSHRIDRVPIEGRSVREFRYADALRMPLLPRLTPWYAGTAAPQC